MLARCGERASSWEALVGEGEEGEGGEEVRETVHVHAVADEARQQHKQQRKQQREPPRDLRGGRSLG